MVLYSCAAWAKVGRISLHHFKCTHLLKILLALYIWGKKNSEQTKRKSYTEGQRGEKKST